MNWKRFFFSMLALTLGLAVMAVLTLAITWVIETFGVLWFIGGFVATLIIGASVTAGLTKDIE